MSDLRALTAAEVGELCGYTKRQVLALYRAGKFPAPIDPTLTTYMWRWSSVVMDDYRAGRDWRAA